MEFRPLESARIPREEDQSAAMMVAEKTAPEDLTESSSKTDCTTGLMVSGNSSKEAVRSSSNGTGRRFNMESRHIRNGKKDRMVKKQPVQQRQRRRHAGAFLQTDG